MPSVCKRCHGEVHRDTAKIEDKHLSSEEVTELKALRLWCLKAFSFLLDRVLTSDDQ